MKILFLNCFDIKNPRKGGAESYTFNLAKRLINDGHEVVWISSMFRGAKRYEEHQGIKFRRFGGRITVIPFALAYIIRYRKSFDIVIDQFHGIPYFAILVVPHKKLYTIIHEIADEIWQWMVPFPFNRIGKFFEKFLIRFIYRNQRFITVSDSSKNDLMKFNIDHKNITIIPNGLEQKQIGTVSKNKYHLINFGGIRPMKRIEDQIDAINLLVKEFPQIKLKITGIKSGRYYNSLLKKVRDLDLEDNVEFSGYLSKDDLSIEVASAYINLGTSVKEGWGLVNSESANLGTPSVCYKVHGFVDSVKHYKTGLITYENSPLALSKAIKRMLIDEKLYKRFQKQGLLETKEMTWEKSYEKFKKLIFTESVEKKGSKSGRRIYNLNSQIFC